MSTNIQIDIASSPPTPPPPTTSLIRDVDTVDLPNSPIVTTPGAEAPLRAKSSEDDPLRVKQYVLYQVSIPLCILFYTLSVLTLGIFYVICHWYPRLKIMFTCRLSDINTANRVLVYGQNGSIMICRVVEIVEDGESSTSQSPTLRYFEYKYQRYIYNQSSGQFEEPSYALSPSEALSIANNGGLSTHQIQPRRNMFGDNLLNVKVKSIPSLLLDEVLHPFFIFQIFAIVIWSLDQYYIYAAAILVLSSASVAVTLYQTRRNLAEIRQMAMYECDVSIQRDAEKFKSMSSITIVPGDVISIKDEQITSATGFILPCDVFLISGSCVVNEAMLTGESVPVIKHSDGAPTDPHSRVLFAGTEVLRATPVSISNGGTHDDAVIGVVMRTGFQTTKGYLVRTILFPLDTNFQFYRDSFKFLLVMFGLSAIGMIFAIITFAHYNKPAYHIVLRALDLITIAVPPALFAAITLGVEHALKRLRDKGIYCIQPSRVNSAGVVDIVCFDKTGTLTEDHMDVFGAYVYDKSSQLGNYISCEDLYSFSPLVSASFQASLGTCHSLHIVHDRIVGDPMDIKILNVSGYTIEDNKANTESSLPLVASSSKGSFSIVKQFHFASDLQRMTVCYRKFSANNTTNKDTLYVSTKGAPEKIITLCSASSTPPHILDVCNDYAKEGYRVLAVASRELSSGSWSLDDRETLECQMNFEGLIILENRLKVDSSGALAILMDAGLRCLIVTGDHLLTAIHIAKQTGILISETKYTSTPSIAHSSHHTPIKTHTFLVEWCDTEVIGDTESRLSDLIRFKYLSGDALKGPSTDDVIAACRGDGEMSGTIQLVMTGITFLYFNRYRSALTLQGKPPSATLLDVDFLLVNTAVFARMRPESKASLVVWLNDLELSTCMCGDGANDCGALKSAHVGISLSEAEASIAAPFTSKIASVHCVIELIREGRAAISTSFHSFKFMALYSLTQFMSVLRLYNEDANLSDPQFLYIDIVLILPLAIVLGTARAWPKLHRGKPASRLVSVPVIATIVGQATIFALFIFGANLLVEHKNFYIPCNPDVLRPAGVPTANPKETQYMCSDVAATFLYANFLYVIALVISYVGPPYQQPFYKSYFILITTIILLILSGFLMLFAPKTLTDFMKYGYFDQLGFGPILILFAIANFVASVLYEWIVVGQLSGMNCCGNDCGRINKRMEETPQVASRENRDTDEDSPLIINRDENTKDTHGSMDDNRLMDGERFESVV